MNSGQRYQGFVIVLSTAGKDAKKVKTRAWVAALEISAVS